MSTVEDFRVVLKAAIDSLDKQVQRKVYTYNVPWKASAQIKESIESLIKAGNQLSDSSTKLAVLKTQNVAFEHLGSLGEEMANQTHVLLSHYFVFLAGPVTPYLVGEVSGCVREELVQLVALVDLILSLKKAEKTPENIMASATGLVWAASESIQKLPLGNRNACRRSVMQTMGMLKDSVREYEEYLAETADDIDEDDEDFSESEPYLPEEAVVVRKFVYTLQLAIRSYKCTMGVMTAVADVVDSEIASTNVPSSVFNASSSTEVTPVSVPSEGLDRCRNYVNRYCNQVISSLPKVLELLSQELFHPFDDAPIADYFEQSWVMAKELLVDSAKFQSSFADSKVPAELIAETTKLIAAFDQLRGGKDIEDVADTLASCSIK